MRVDLHMHTSRYSPCAKATAEAMMEAALQRGLNGVVITEHNVMWKDEEIRALRESFPALRIFRGIEVFTEEQEELLIFGVPDAETLSGHLPCAEVVRRVRESGGATVLAHPLRYRDTIHESLRATPPDACEGWSLNIYAFQRPGIRAFCEATGSGLTASSDGHATFGVGIFAVDFDSAIGDEKDLAAALRERRYTPYQNENIVAELEHDLPNRVEDVRQGLAAGEDKETIHGRVHCSFSFIGHVAGGRYPTMAG